MNRTPPQTDLYRDNKRPTLAPGSSSFEPRRFNLLDETANEDVQALLQELVDVVDETVLGLAQMYRDQVVIPLCKQHKLNYYSDVIFSMANGNFITSVEQADILGMGFLTPVFETLLRKLGRSNKSFGLLVRDVVCNVGDSMLTATKYERGTYKDDNHVWMHTTGVDNRWFVCSTLGRTWFWNVKTNEWCLPFGMSPDELHENFGLDYNLARRLAETVPSKKTLDNRDWATKSG